MSAKVIERVSALDAGASYEGLQMLKTAFYRFGARKQPAEARAVLLEGALLMLRRGQVTCATELGRMLVDALSRQQQDEAGGAGADGDGGGADADAAEGLCGVLAAFAALPAPTPGAPAAAVDAQVDEVGRFAMEAVKWAHKRRASAATVARMHDLYAEYVTRAAGWRRLGTAAAHYCRGADAAAFAAAVALAAAAAAAAAAASGGGGRAREEAEEEEGLFAARAALQTLACARAATRADRAAHAAAFLQAYPLARRKAAAAGAGAGGVGGAAGAGAAGVAASAAASAASPGALPDAPVCRFAGMFVELLANQHPHEPGAPPSRTGKQVARLLREKYAPALAAPDPSLAACALRAERVWFPPPPGQGGGMGGGLLGGLLQGLLGEEGDEDDE